ncbi:MAG: DUF3343 domain-containing protein [Tissierellia bacterium]|nr:DUF3343 domain-containing protein [Tissierellia bacterium]NLV77225.1 DUF3343 domain-containing protein [Tissierellia bacterium]
MDDVYCVVTFHVTQHALIFEKAMKEAQYPIKLMPVPRQVSSSCGTAAKIPCDKKEEILNLCKEKALPIEGFYRIEHKKKKYWF